MVRGRERIAGVGLLLALSVVAAVTSAAAPDYRGMVDRIGAYLEDALAAYRKGDAARAKARVQSAYFEIFENLEGPIRVNISAQKNFELESRFGEIRRMIVQGAPAQEIERLVSAHMAELRAILPDLQQGSRIEAEAAPPPAPAAAAAGPIEPLWNQTVERIAGLLADAVAAYEAGKAVAARELLLAAQYSGYKNSLLETAVRRHVSQGRDAEHNRAFAGLLTAIRDGEPRRNVQSAARALVTALRQDLPGLPLVAGAQPAAPEASSQVDWNVVATRITRAVDQAIVLYEGGRADEAVARIQDTYFDVFEASGMEARLGARDPDFKARMEAHFNRLAGQITAGRPPGDMRGTLAALTADLERAVALLREGASSPLALLAYSLLIIVREGFEALLIVTAIVTYLVKSGHADKLRVVYNSVIVALLASVLTAVLMRWVFNASAASRELLEGITMLAAALVLFSVSYWVISKAEARRWMAYIRETVNQSLSSGSLRALWLAGFLAVYREGAETVLFYQALVIDANAQGSFAIAAGFAAGCVLLGGLFVAMRLGVARLPIRPVFLVTGALLYLMAFVFAGKGAMELGEAGVFSFRPLSWAPELPLLGLFPYWQTLSPQLALLLAALIGLYLVFRRREA